MGVMRHCSYTDYIHTYIRYIQIASGEFHTEKSRIVLNNNGAVITMCFYSMSFYTDQLFVGLRNRPVSKSI